MLAREHGDALRAVLGSERCCSLHASHVAITGHGQIRVDRWPSPRVALAFTGGNLGLWGEPAALEPEALGAFVRDLLAEWDRVFIDPGDRFEPVVRRAVDGLWSWPRVVYAGRGSAPTPPRIPDVEARLLAPGDAGALRGLHPSLAWIADTHGGPDALAASDRAVGAFVAGRLASVAAVFYQGAHYEELGVVTDPDHRGRGLSTCCAAILALRSRQRGRIPCWSTTPDNLASRRVAEKLGFALESEPRHLLAGAPVTGCLALD